MGLILPAPLGFSLLGHILGITFQPFKLLVWPRIIDKGSLPDMRIWSILLHVLRSDLKWWTHISRSLFLYLNNWRAITFVWIYCQYVWVWVYCLRHMQRYFSHICDGTDVQTDWRRSCTNSRAPNAIDISQGSLTCPSYTDTGPTFLYGDSDTPPL